MKELIYTTKDGNNPRKKMVSVRESFDKRDMHIEKQWISKYYIKARHDSTSIRDLKEWIDIRQCRAGKIKNCHVLRHYDSNSNNQQISI